MNNPNPVKIVETVLRDGHQSLCATRMRTSDMLPMLEAWMTAASMPWKPGAAPPMTPPTAS